MSEEQWPELDLNMTVEEARQYLRDLPDEFFKKVESKKKESK